MFIALLFVLLGCAPRPTHTTDADAYRGMRVIVRGGDCPGVVDVRGDCPDTTAIDLIPLLVAAKSEWLTRAVGQIQI